MDDLPHSPPLPHHPHPQHNDSPPTHRRPELCTIRVATLNDLRFVRDLQARNSNLVGFLPSLALLRYVTAGHVLLAALDRQPVAYLLGRPALAWQPLLRSITQICVAETCRRSGIARLLIARTITDAIGQSQAGIQACCRQDLEANAFWASEGFVKICYMAPQNARNCDVICWRKPLIKKLPLWFAAPPKRAGHRASKPIIRDRQRRHPK